MDLDHELTGARPADRPSPEVRERHRRALADLIDTTAPGVPAGDVGVAGDEQPPATPVPLARRPRPATTAPWRRPRVVAPAAAALLLVAAVAGLVGRGVGDGPTTDVTASGDPADRPGDVTPACTGPLPIRVDLSYAGRQVTTELDVAPGGARAWRLAAGDVAVDVVWPATSPPTYGTDAVIPRGLEHAGAPAWGGELALRSLPPESQELPTGGVTVLPTEGITPSPGCDLVELTVREPGSEPIRFAWDTTAEANDAVPLVDIRPLIGRSTAVEVAPLPEGRSATRANSPGKGLSPQSTPSRSFAEFLEKAPSELGRAGFVEMITPDGTRVYGAPVQDLEGNVDETRFNHTVTVEEGTDGWSVASWRSGVCF